MVSFAFSSILTGESQHRDLSDAELTLARRHLLRTGSFQARRIDRIFPTAHLGRVSRDLDISLRQI